MEDSERMRKDNELYHHYMTEAKSCAQIGVLTTVWMFVMSIGTYYIPSFNEYYSMTRNWMWIGLVILFVGTPYELIKVYRQRRKIIKEWGYVREYL